MEDISPAVFARALRRGSFSVLEVVDGFVKGRPHSWLRTTHGSIIDPCPFEGNARPVIYHKGEELPFGYQPNSQRSLNEEEIEKLVSELQPLIERFKKTLNGNGKTS